MKKDNKGLTLIEIIIGIAIVGVIIAIAYPTLNKNVEFGDEQSNLYKQTQSISILEEYLIKDISNSTDVSDLENITNTKDKIVDKYRITNSDNSYTDYTINIDKEGIDTLDIVRKKVDKNKEINEIQLVSDVEIDVESPFKIEKNGYLGDENYVITLDTKVNHEPYTIQVASKKITNYAVSQRGYLKVEGPYKGYYGEDDTLYPSTFTQKTLVALDTREELGIGYINGNVAIPIDLRLDINNTKGGMDDTRIVYKPYTNKSDFIQKYQNKGSSTNPSDKMVKNYEVAIYFEENPNNQEHYNKIRVSIEGMEYTNGDIVSKEEIEGYITNILNKKLDKVLTRNINIFKKDINTIQFEFDDETKITELVINDSLSLHPEDVNKLSPLVGSSGYRGYRVVDLPQTGEILKVKCKVNVVQSVTQDPDQRLMILFGTTSEV